MDELNAQIASNADFICITENAQVSLSLKYASDDNFMGRNIYNGFHGNYLHQIAFDKFVLAQEILKKCHNDLKFIVYDALRPLRFQHQLWKTVANTPYENYVSNPKIGSMHNYGMAIDLTLAHKNGDVLDMGTKFDSFESKAEPQLEQEMLRQNRLNMKQVNNRLILRSIMQQAGFIQLAHEWWHYNALSSEKVRGNFLIIDYEYSFTRCR